MKSETLLNKEEEKTFILVFDKGDEAVQGLKEFAQERHLAGSRFTAVGALSQVTLGYFDRERNTYKKIPLSEQVEVLSLAGNITAGDKGPQLHAHIVVGDSQGDAHGGHLLEGRVWPTLEVVIEETPSYLPRKADPDTGLALIDLSGTVGSSALQLRSPAFKRREPIPAKYTCKGANVSPPLSWGGNPPGGTRSFALIMDDPDALQSGFVHWVLYNLPATAQELRENISKDAEEAMKSHILARGEWMGIFP